MRQRMFLQVTCLQPTCSTSPGRAAAAPAAAQAQHPAERGLAPQPASLPAWRSGVGWQDPLSRCAPCWQRCLLAHKAARWLSCWQCCGSTHIFENPLGAFGVWALLHASLGKAGISLSILIIPASLTGSLREWGKRAAALPFKWGQPKAARLLNGRQAACGGNQFNQRLPLPHSAAPVLH